MLDEGFRATDNLRFSPEIRDMPAIIRFLGYNPLVATKTMAEQLFHNRTNLGLSQKELAVRQEEANAIMQLGVELVGSAGWYRGLSIGIKRLYIYGAEGLGFRAEHFALIQRKVLEAPSQAGPFDCTPVKSGTAMP